MSTKIYNGVRFKSNDFNQIIGQLSKLKQDIENILLEDIGFLSEMFFYMMRHNYDFIKEDLSDENWRYKFVKLESDLYKDLNTSNSLNPSVDFEIAIYYHPEEDCYHGLTFNSTNSKELDKILFERNIVEDYHYQNQTDKPEYISDNEWNKRREIWDYHLPGLGFPKDRGVFYKIYDAYNFGYTQLKKVIKTLQMNEIQRRINEKELKLLQSMPQNLKDLASEEIEKLKKAIDNK